MRAVSPISYNMDPLVVLSEMKKIVRLRFQENKYHFFLAY